MLDDLLGVGGPCFGRVVGRMCPAGLRLGGASSSGTGAPFLDLGLSMADGVVSFEICGGLDDFNFEVVVFPFLDGVVPRSPSCGVYISQLIRFARVCSSVDGFGSRGLFLTAELLKQGCGCHTVRRAFSGFYHRHSGLVVGCGVGLKALLQQGVSELIFYGDLVCGFGRIVGKSSFGDQFRGIVGRCMGYGCGLDVVRRSACLVLGPVLVCGCGFLFG